MRRTRSKKKFQKLGMLSLAALTFYSVSGGPFGIEDVVRAAGPYYALWGFSLMLVWSVPVSKLDSISEKLLLLHTIVLDRRH